jgi:hypothetical protein
MYMHSVSSLHAELAASQTTESQHGCLHAKHVCCAAPAVNRKSALTSVSGALGAGTAVGPSLLACSSWQVAGAGEKQGAKVLGCYTGLRAILGSPR